MTEQPRSVEPLSAACEHAEVVAYRGDQSVSRHIALWVCANPECSIRFYPACPTCIDVGHRNVEHPADTRETPAGLDEEDWAAIRGCVAACAGDHREPERYREWYAEVLVKIDRLAAARLPAAEGSEE